MAVVQVNIHERANRDLIQEVEAQFTPTFVLFDRTGRVVWRAVGSLEAAEVKQQVARLD